MKDLQQKYKAHKTPFDESAFEHFKTIQRKRKVGAKIHSWHILVVVLLLSIPAAFYISSLIASRDVEIQDVSLASNQEVRQDTELETFNTNKTKKYDNEIVTKEEKPIATKHILKEKIINKPTLKLITTQKEANSTPTITEEDIVNDTHDYSTSTNQYLTTQNNDVFSDKIDITPYQTPTIAAQKTVDITQAKNNTQKTQTAELFDTQSLISEMPLLKHEDVQDFELLPILNPVAPPTPTKTWAHYRNHLKLSHNYIRFYPESNLLGLIPGSKTPSYFIQGEYFREFNQIISLGSSVGYARGGDPNTQVQDSLGYQRVTFAHLNLYLFLVNSKKHRLYLKAGSGITNAKKQVIAMDATNSILIFERTNMAALMEFSYSYHFTDQWFMSANVGKIWYDDTLYLGLSLGYAF